MPDEPDISMGSPLSIHLGGCGLAVLLGDWQSLPQMMYLSGKADDLCQDVRLPDARTWETV